LPKASSTNDWLSKKERTDTAVTTYPPSSTWESNSDWDHNLTDISNNTQSQALVWKDGAYFMIWKNGRKQKVEYSQYSQSSLFKESLEKQNARLPLVRDISIFLEAYSAEYPKETQKVDKAWKLAIDFLQNGANDEQKVTNQIVIETLGVGWGNTKWYDAFAIKDNAQRRLEIYKLIKSMGQYDLVIQHIANDYMNSWNSNQVSNALSQLSQWKTLENFSEDSSKK